MSSAASSAASSSSSLPSQLPNPSGEPFRIFVVSGCRFEVPVYYQLLRPIGQGAYGVVWWANCFRYFLVFCPSFLLLVFFIQFCKEFRNKRICRDQENWKRFSLLCSSLQTPLLVCFLLQHLAILLKPSELFVKSNSCLTFVMKMSVFLTLFSRCCCSEACFSFPLV